MKEEYYLIHKSIFDERLTTLNSITIKPTYAEEVAIGAVKRNIDIFISNSALIDLSDSAIEEAVDLDYSKVRKYDDGFDRKKGYRTALTNLKNKLNGNK